VPRGVFACGAARTHGLRFTNADKRRAVLAMLEECPQWSDRRIAEWVGVSAPTVATVREEVSVKDLQMPQREVTRNGSTYTMQTENIGKRTELPTVASEDLFPQDRSDEEDHRTMRPSELPAPPVEADPAARPITVDDWIAMKPAAQKRLLVNASGESKFNSQGNNENIEWALWSWNPVTGCRHNCPYCYARDIANRFYETKFEPALWAGRLGAPCPPGPRDNLRLPLPGAVRQGGGVHVGGTRLSVPR
jgi:hypothetical protein